MTDEERFQRMIDDPDFREAVKVWTEEQALNQRADLQSHDATIRYSDVAIRSLLILSGGAAIAVLSFAGTKGLNLISYAGAVVYFGFSAAGAVFVAGLSYLAQSLFTSDWNRFGRALQWAAIVIWLAAWVAFCVGVLRTADAVMGDNSPALQGSASSATSAEK